MVMISDKEKNRLLAQKLGEMGLQLHPPHQVLYKYVDIEIAKLILENGTVMYQTPEKFNDPLDPHFALIDMGNIVRQRSEQFPIEQRKLYVERATKVVRDIVKRQTYTTGILSLSLTQTHTLMWSHYAKSHTGACIGFKYVGIGEDGVTAFRVLYDDDIKPLSYQLPVEQDENFIAMINLLCRKAKVWEYEQEVRDIKIGKAGIHRFHPAFVCEVYFGANTSDENVQEIIKLLQRKGYNNQYVRIGKMMLSDKKFELDIKALTF